MLDYMGYKISAATDAPCTANIHLADSKGREEQAAVCAASAEAAIEQAKKVVRVAVRSKLPLSLAVKVAGA